MVVISHGMRLRVEHERVAPRHCLTLDGELDLATAPVLERAVIELCLTGGELVVDLSAVSFIDSTGLRAILVCQTLLQRVNCRFVLRSPSTRVRNLLELTGLLGHLTVLPGANPAAD